MNRISALIHTLNHESSLARGLETLRPIDQVVVVDHGSTDGTMRVAREYGAKWIRAVPGVDRGAYAIDCSHDWLLCMLPTESLSETLEASLFEWKQQDHAEKVGFLVEVRAEANSGADLWQKLEAEMRLANRSLINWPEYFPSPVDGAPLISGDLLRFKT